MKKLTLLILAALIAASNFAQASEEVALVTIGQGSTKREATENALRSAIEQAFGVFVSANTEILNDELIKDEIATVSSGNIQSYEEISSDQLADGTYEVTLKAVVSINKLVTYAQSHGSSCELSGQKFLMGLKMIELQQENAIKATDHFLTKIEHYIQTHDMWDCNLKLYDPYVDNDKFALPMEIVITSNQKAAEDLLVMAIQYGAALSVSSAYMENLKNKGLPGIVDFRIDDNQTETLLNAFARVSERDRQIWGYKEYEDYNYPNKKRGSFHELFLNIPSDIMKERFDDRLNNLSKMMAFKCFVLYDNNQKIYYVNRRKDVTEFDEWDDYSNDFLNIVSNLSDSRESQGSYLGCSYNSEPVYDNGSYCGAWWRICHNSIRLTEGAIIFSREELARLTDMKLEMYDSSPIKTIYGESYIEVCHKNDPSLLKKQQ
jgi:hypothetical protein